MGEIDYMKLVADLKFLNFIEDCPKNKFIWPLKVEFKLLIRVWVVLGDCFCTPTKNQVFDKIWGLTFKLLVRVWVGLGDCFCTSTKNRVFDKVGGRIRICLFQKKCRGRPVTSKVVENEIFLCHFVGQKTSGRWCQHSTLTKTLQLQLKRGVHIIISTW